MIAYRDATPDDGAELDAFARAIWAETFAWGTSAEDAETYLDTAYGPEGRLLRDLNAGAAWFRLAIEDGRIVGYAKLGPTWLPDAEPGTLQLSQIYVSRHLQGAGVGAALMDWTIARARDEGAAALLLTVWERNPRAIGFYRRLGFEQVGEYAFPVGRQIDTDLVLRLAL